MKYYLPSNMVFILNSEKKRNRVIDYNTSMRGRMISYALLQILILLQGMRVEGGEYCQYGYPSYTYQTTYCTYGCCGTKYSYYSDICCSYNYNYNSYSDTFQDDNYIGVIVGSVVGGLAGLAILIVLIVCCCVAAKKSGRQVGAAIQPANTNMQPLTVNSTAFTQGQPTFIGPQGAVVYGYPTAFHPSQNVQHHNVSQGSADPANPTPEVRY